MKHWTALAGAVMLGAMGLATPAMAATTTLGSVTPPSESDLSACVGESQAGFITMRSSAAAIPYEVPAGGGRIVSWQTDAEGGEEGAPLGMVVLRPTGAGPSGGPAYEVVGSDLEVSPTPIPAGGVVTFDLQTPIRVSRGDLLGRYLPADSKAPCFFDQGQTPSEDQMEVGTSSGAPQPGQELEGGVSISAYLLDIAATLVTKGPTVVGLVTATAPTAATAGQLAELDSTVGDSGEEEATEVTFTDTVPAGLTISQAVAGSGSCSISGQTVSCQIPAIAAGASVPVVVTVVPSAAGTYVNDVSASATNATSAVGASATLDVAAAPIAIVPAPTTPQEVPRKCEVPSLKKVPLAVAKRVLTLLDCRVGEVSKLASKKVASGEVIATKPGAGSYAAERKISLTVSRGASKGGKTKKVKKKRAAQRGKRR